MVTQLRNGQWVDVTDQVRAENAALRDALHAHGISYAQFARACGRNPSTISATLNADWPLPGWLWRVADDLGLTKGEVA